MQFIKIKKYPLSLRLFFGGMIVCSICLVLFSLHAYYRLNATSWNFGGMGMYTNIDYPGNRWLTIQQKNNKTGDTINLDSSAVRFLFFKEYESYLSLPTQKNADRLVKKITNPNYTSTIRVWTFKYDSNDQSVTKILKATHEVHSEITNQPI